MSRNEDEMDRFDRWFSRFAVVISVVVVVGLVVVGWGIVTLVNWVVSK